MSGLEVNISIASVQIHRLGEPTVFFPEFTCWLHGRCRLCYGYGRLDVTWRQRIGERSYWTTELVNIVCPVCAGTGRQSRLRRYSARATQLTIDNDGTPRIV